MRRDVYRRKQLGYFVLVLDRELPTERSGDIHRMWMVGLERCSALATPRSAIEAVLSRRDGRTDLQRTGLVYADER